MWSDLTIDINPFLALMTSYDVLDEVFLSACDTSLNLLLNLTLKKKKSVSKSGATKLGGGGGGGGSAFLAGWFSALLAYVSKVLHQRHKFLGRQRVNSKQLCIILVCFSPFSFFFFFLPVLPDAACGAMPETCKYLIWPGNSGITLLRGTADRICASLSELYELWALYFSHQ